MNIGLIIDAAIPFFGGVFGLLLATGVLPKNPKDPERTELWRKKFGPIMMILSPLLIVFGLLKLFMGF